VPRTRQSLVRFAAVGVLASALAFGAASPALAFGPADVTLTPTTTGEDQLTTLAVVCPAPSDSVDITWTGTDGGVATVYGPFNELLDASGEYADDYYFETFFDRDTDVTVDITCLDAGTPSGTDSAVFHLPTTGAVHTGPASRGINQDITVTGNCGTSANIDSIRVEAYRVSTDTVLAGFPSVVPYTNAADYSITVGSGNSLGVVQGDSIDVYVVCHSTDPAPHNVSNRVNRTLMLAAVVAPAAGGAALAATGTDLTVPLIAATALVAAGAALLLIRRNRRHGAAQA
jgi:LPXTG-motif cell wall-anchored protein